MTALPGFDAPPREGRSTRRVIGAGRAAVRAYGMATSRWRPDPDFLIIGAKRGGSTSFFYDLIGHPQIEPLFPGPDLLPKATATKGTHYFDIHYARGERWYRSHLPSAAARRRRARRHGAPALTGEASPYYLFHPFAAERAASLVPQARILVVLRNPVERAYSHWKERRRAGAETLDFSAALDAEAGRLARVDEAGLERPGAYSYAHEQQSYFRQSCYAEGLARWLAHYPPDRVLVLASEDYYLDPGATLAVATRFLGLHDHALAGGPIRNAAPDAALDPAVRAELAGRFTSHTEELERLTARHFAWVQ